MQRQKLALVSQTLNDENNPMFTRSERGMGEIGKGVHLS